MSSAKETMRERLSEIMRPEDFNAWDGCPGFVEHLTERARQGTLVMISDGRGRVVSVSDAPKVDLTEVVADGREAA